MSTRKRSIVWSYFKKSPNNSTLAKCVFCDSQVAHTNTSNLLKHLRELHRRETAHLWNDGTLTSRVSPEKINESWEEESETNSTAATTILTELSPGKLQFKEGSYFVEVDPELIQVDKAATAIRLESPSMRKGRSAVWRYFKKSDGNSDCAVCTICKINIRQQNSSTTNLLKHILNRHPVEYELISSKKPFSMSSARNVLKSNKPFRSPCFGPIRRNRSIVWRYFVKNLTEETQVLCSFCGRMLKQPVGSTSNLVKHLYAKHHKEYRKMFPEDCSETFVADETDDEDADEEEIDEDEIIEPCETKMETVESDFCDSHSAQDNTVEDGELDDLRISEKFDKVQRIWLQQCEEREQQFSELMKSKRKEITEIHESLRKLQQNLTAVTYEVELHTAKRKAELIRQEVLNSQILPEKEAVPLKQRHRQVFYQTCSLVDDALSEEILLPKSTSRLTNSSHTSVRELSPTCLNHQDSSDKVKACSAEKFSLNSEKDAPHEHVLYVVPLNKIEKDGWSNGANLVQLPTKTEAEPNWSEVCTA